MFFLPERSEIVYSLRIAGTIINLSQPKLVTLTIDILIRVLYKDCY